MLRRNFPKILIGLLVVSVIVVLVLVIFLPVTRRWVKKLWSRIPLISQNQCGHDN